jgi:uncharacterized membrane protein
VYQGHWGLEFVREATAEDIADRIDKLQRKENRLRKSAAGQVKKWKAARKMERAINGTAAASVCGKRLKEALR